jgi:hypothetical protein
LCVDVAMQPTVFIADVRHDGFRPNNGVLVVDVAVQCNQDGGHKRGHLLRVQAYAQIV